MKKKYLGPFSDNHGRITLGQVENLYYLKRK